MKPTTLTYDCRGQRLVTRRWGDGPRHAMLLHGFPDDADSMAGIATRLAQADYTVWAPFLRGYHPSGLAHDGRYDMVALAEDISGLLSAVGARQCVLVGHDWGAAIAYAVSALKSPHISKVVGVSVPPFTHFLRACRGPSKQLVRSAYMLGFQLRGIAEARLRRGDMAMIETLWRKWSPDWEPPPQRLADVKQTLGTGETLTAALNYYRAARPGFSAQRRHAWSLMKTPPIHPVSCLVGARDGCIAPETFRFVEYPVEVVPNAGHFIPLEAPEAICDHILRA